MSRIKDHIIEMQELRLLSAEELVQRVKVLREELSDIKHFNKKNYDRAFEAEARVHELEQAFRCYASHDEDCSVMTHPHDCSCGYRAILSSLSSGVS